MELNLIIAIFGIVATIVFGFLSIDLFKRKKYPGKLTYIELSLIDLLNNVANNFKEIELLHNKQPIRKNIIYIKGALINNGDVDINSKLTEKDISIILPSGSKWLDIKVTDYSDDLNTEVIINDANKASFKFDLFRKNEFIKFEGLIESESNDISSEIINSDISFTHRIENTSKINKKVLLSENEIAKKKKYAIVYGIIIFSFLFLLIATNIFNLFGTKKETVYYKKVEEKNNTFYSISQNNGIIYLKPYNGGEKLCVNFEDFNKNYEPSNCKLTFWQKFKDYYWMISSYIAFFIIMVLLELIEIRNAKKIVKIFKK